MAISQTGVKAHDDIVNLQEGIRQVAVAGRERGSWAPRDCCDAQHTARCVAMW
jgi:hypothetical protein